MVLANAQLQMWGLSIAIIITLALCVVILAIVTYLLIGVVRAWR